jgi:hypothetical protein
MPLRFDFSGKFRVPGLSILAKFTLRKTESAKRRKPVAAGPSLKALPASGIDGDHPRPTAR